MQTRSVMAMGVLLNFYEGGPGDSLPWHSHDEDHLTVVVRGRATVANRESSISLTPEDDPVIFRAGSEHMLAIEEPNTTFINIFTQK